jgi:hypothetical protein
MTFTEGDRLYIVSERDGVRRFVRQPSGKWICKGTNLSATDVEVRVTIKYRKCFLARAGSDVIEGHLENE